MARSRQRWTEHQVEQIVGNLLRGGVILSATVVLVGGVLYLIRYGMNAPNYQVFRGEPTDLRTIPGIVADALALRRRGLICVRAFAADCNAHCQSGFFSIRFCQAERSHLHHHYTHCLSNFTIQLSQCCIRKSS